MLQRSRSLCSVIRFIIFHIANDFPSVSFFVDVFVLLGLLFRSVLAWTTRMCHFLIEIVVVVFIEISVRHDGLMFSSQGNYRRCFYAASLLTVLLRSQSAALKPSTGPRTCQTYAEQMREHVSSILIVTSLHKHPLLCRFFVSIKIASNKCILYSISTRWIFL